MSPEQAALLTEMMEETVTTGTARRIFRQRGFRVPGAVGKTGSLADKQPFRDYSWFVGFAVALWSTSYSRDSGPMRRR
jgi:membrane carboxypeptidase/penicillin-binding protein